MNLSSIFSHATITAGHWLAQVDARATSPTVAPTTGGGGGGASGGAAAGDGNPMFQIGMMVVFFAIFYFLVLRPQSQQRKKDKAFQDGLQVGARIVLRSGIFGKVVALEGNEARIEIADRTVVRVVRSQIVGLETNAVEAVAEANGQK